MRSSQLIAKIIVLRRKTYEKDASKTLRRKRKQNISSLFLEAVLQNKYRQSSVYQAKTHEY